MDNFGDIKMNSVLELNNRAIHCIQNGDAFEACELLTSASSICLEVTDAPKRKRQGMVHRDHIISWVNFSSCHPSLYHYAPAIRRPCCEEQYASNKFCGNCRDDSNVCPCSIAPVIWYNLALSCQIQGSECGGGTVNGNFYFTRSLYLYEKVLSICSRERPGSAAGGLSNLKMAILNNLACVYHELGRTEECIIIKQALKRNLHTFSSRNPRRMLRNWRIFHVNLMMMGSDRPAPAA